MKKMLSFVLSLVLILCLAPASFATTQNLPYDVLSKTQSEYVSLATVTPTLGRLAITESQNHEIEETCKSFLSLCRASVRSSAYSPDVLIDSSHINDNRISYRLCEYQNLASLFSINDTPILNDSILFSDFKYTINGNSATASIVEKYTYYADDGFDSESYRMREYFFTLSNESGHWRITDIRTNDPWEDNDFDYKIVSSEEMYLNSIDTVSEDYDISTQYKNEDNDNVYSASLYTWNYNTSVAVGYAVNHYSDDTSSSGLLFPYNENGNCQNFASQCLWAGLIGDLSVAESYSSRTAIPAISPTYAGTNATNIWCYGKTSTAHGGKCSWYSCTGFAKMLGLSSSTTEGPYGAMIYKNLGNASVGDIVYWTDSATASNSNLKHAMFITEVTGSYGSRTKSNIKIAAHTSNTNSAYASLASYDVPSHTVDQYARAKIYSGHYARAQSSINNILCSEGLVYSHVLIQNK